MGEDKTPSKAVHAWLWTVYVMIFAMVLIGGITRLTGSGLSMVEWRPLMGTLPPSSEKEWQDVFDKYKKSPQYKKVNHWMKLADFKRIFFWEYLHRLFGRLIGVVFILPWLVLLIRRKLPGSLKWKTALAFVLGGLQGLLGWFMVKSGLVNMPAVSHYRLAAHLLLAFVTAAWVLWLLFELRSFERGDELTMKDKAPGGGWLLLGLVALQIVYGAFMAGMRAGHMYSTWPSMNGELIPTGWLAMPGGFFKNIFENPIAVHFIHRLLGYLVAIVAIVQWFRWRRSPRIELERAANTLLFVVLAQVVLGIVTVVVHVNVWVATAHQAGGFLLMSVVLWTAHAQRKPTVSRPSRA
jgi:cytochrome c oxidase assembly protein subunit 15